jgi:hypothetical protein
MTMEVRVAAAIVTIAFSAVFVLVGVVCLIWRVNMMAYHPERYRQFREFEKEFADAVQEKQGEGQGRPSRMAYPSPRCF